MPNEDKAMRFKSHIIPGLVKLIETEAEHETYNTLSDAITLILIYSEITMKEKPSK